MQTDTLYPTLKHVALSMGSYWKGTRKTMALFTGYFDEGGHEHDPFFVMGGLALDVDKLEDFESDWRNAIKDLPIHPQSKCPYLHTANFMNGEKQFSGWKGRYTEKAIVLNNLAKVIDKHYLRIFTCVMDMSQFSQLNEEIQLSEALGMPYALLVRFSWELVRAWQYRTNFDNPIAMMVEERIGGGEVYELFYNDRQPIPQTGDKTMPALQAADYITWMRQQRITPCNGYRHVAKSWEAIGKMRHDDWYLDRRDMLMICEETEKLGKGRIPKRGDELQTRFERNINRPRPRFKSRVG